MRFWALFVALSPLLLWQARRTRATTPRLPEASGDTFGLAAAANGSPGRLLVVGESTAASVGVAFHHQGLAAHTARALSRQQRRPVHWHTLGVNGIRARALVQYLDDHPRLPPNTDPLDFAIISLGVNDTTGLTSIRRYRDALRDLIAVLRRQQPDLPVYLLAIAPMQHFTALPTPLRQLLGQRAARLDREQQALARQLDGVRHLVYPISNTADSLAEDGYHPSEKGYNYIGERIAATLNQFCSGGTVNPPSA